MRWPMTPIGPIERIFHVGIWKENEMKKFIHYTSFLEASHIKETFPEVEASCAIFHQKKKAG